MGLTAGRSRSANVPVNNVFVGSCTNGRLSDLRNAARVLRGHKLAQGVKMLVVPGSQAVKRAAEAEGLDQVFLDAGAEWRESGCSMCLGMNGDLVPAGPLFHQHQQSQFRRPPGHGRAHAARQPRDRRRVRHPRPRHRSARIQPTDNMPAVTDHPLAHRRAAARPTSTPTRSSRRASSRPRRRPASASTCSPTGATTPPATRSRTSC